MCETWLNSTIDNDEVALEGYQLYRADRKDRAHGGSGIYLNNNYPANSSSVSTFSNGYCEGLALKLEEGNTAIVCMYRPPGTSTTNFNDIIEWMNDWLNKFTDDSTNSLVFGDFNFPYLKWDVCDVEGTNVLVPSTKGGAPRSVQEQGYQLLATMDSLFFTQRVSECTRKGKNTLDLIFTNSDIFGHPLITPNGISDHDTLEWTINLDQVNKPAFDNTEPYFLETVGVSDFRLLSDQTNWDIICSTLEEQLNVDMTDSSVSDQLDYFYSACLKAVQAGAPKRNKPKHFKGIPLARKRLMKKRLKLRKQIEHASNSRKKKNIQLQMIDIEKRILRSIDNDNHQEEKNAIMKIKSDSKSFFKFAKGKKAMKNSIGPVKNKEGKLVYENPGIANELNEQYNDVFNRSVHTPTVTLKQSPNANDVTIKDLFDNENVPFSNIEFNEGNVIDAICMIKNSSAPGSDKMCPIFLKKTAHVSAKFLANLMNKSMSSGEIPAVFKEATVTPIFKGGDSLEPKNYRPISLTSHICKVMERIVKTQVVEYLDANCIISNFQHGFRSQRSTVSALLEHYYNIVDAFECGDELDTVLLDYSKAFDKVPHSILLQKLKRIGVGGKVGRWIGTFLLDRKQRVKVGTSLSNFISVLSGVPQGSILGPLLFIIFINDISVDITNSKVSCYADDSKISHKITGEVDRESLQKDLDKIFDWTDKNCMMFNTDKLEFIRFSRHSSLNPSHCYVNNQHQDITRVQCCRDLGVKFDYDGSFTTHIAEKVAKGRKLCGYILRTFRTRNPDHLLTVYKSIVVPVLEYCCIVWNPSKLPQIRSMEQVQRDFTDRLNYPNTMNYWERLKYLKIFSLERRRERYMILYVFKIMSGLVPNPGIFWDISPRRGRLVCIPPALNRNTYGQNIKDSSFFTLSARLFNILPQEIRDLDCSPEMLKAVLDRFLWKVPDQPRLVGYTNISTAANNSICTQVHFMH